MANLFQAWDEDIQALGAAKASDDQIEARRQQLAEHFKAKAKAAGLSSKKIYETLDQFDAYSRQKTTAQDDQLTPEEQEMTKDQGTTLGFNNGALKEVGKRFKDVGLGVVSSLTRMGGDVAQTVADVGDNDKSELSSQIAQGLYNATDDIRSNYSEGTKQAKKDFWSPAGLTMGVSENLGQIAGSATVFGAAGKLAAARGLGKAATLATMGAVGAPLAYSQGYGQGKESSLDEINKTSNAQLWENVKAEAKAYDDAGGTGEVPYLVGMFKEAGGDLNLMKDLMAENAGNRSGIMTVATEPLAMGVGSVMSRGAAAGGTGVMAKFANAMNNQGMSNELARRIAAGASAAEARKAGQIVGTTALRDNAAIASQAGKIAATQMAREGVQETAQEGLEGYYAKGEGSRAAGRKGELNSADWSGENGIVQQGLQGGAIGLLMGAGGSGVTLRNASKLALEKNGLPEKHDAAIIAKEQADAALVQAANIADANPENIDAQNAYAEAQDAALVATNDLEQLTGKFNALYTPEEQAVIKAATMEGVAARKKVADDAAKAQKELDDAQAKEQADIAAQQAEAIKTQRDAVVNNLAGMVGDDVALSNAVADLGLSEEEANSLLDDAHKVAKKQKKEAAKQPAPATATPKTPFEMAVDEAFNADGTRNPKAMTSDIAKKHNIPLKPLVDAIGERIAQNEKTNQQKSDEIAFAERQAEIARQSAKKASQAQKAQKDAEKSDVLSEKQQLENTLADFAANNDHDSMVNFLRDYEPTEADKLIKNAYASVESKKKAEQDAIAATKKAEALKAKQAEDKAQAEQKKIAFNNDMANLYAANPDRNPTKAELDSVGKKHGVKSPIELAQAWVKAKNEAKAAKEAAPVDQQADAAEVTDEERLNAKKALYSLYKNKGYPDDVVASHIMGEQERANKDGAPRNIWESVSGAIGSSPASQKSPFKDGKLITTIYPESKASDTVASVDTPTPETEPIVRTDGQPFQTQAAAEQALKNKSTKKPRKNEAPITPETHEVIPVDGGYAIAPKPVVEVEQPKKKPDDNEDGGVIADAPKPNAPVSPTGQQAVDNTPTQSIEDDSIKTKHIKQPKKANRTINEDKDDLLAAIAKLNGLNLADAKSQGIDVEAYKGKRAAGLLGVFKQDGTGSDFDTMAEYLSGYGYPVHEGGNTAWDNVTGSYSVNALADALITALNGGDVGTTSYMQNKLQAQMEADQKEAEEMERLFNGKGSSTWDEADALDNVSNAIVDDIVSGTSGIAPEKLSETLKEVSNEPIIEIGGQAPNAKTEARSPQNGDAETTGTGKTGQQESQSSTGQDSGIGLNPSFNLNAQTNEELAKRDAENKAAEAKRQAEEKTAKDKAQADKEVSDFRLSGSNAPADIAMAGGQKDMFAPPTRGEREAEKAQTGRKEAQEIGDAEFDARMKELGYQEQEQIIEHITTKGKTLRGVVRKGITKEEAKLIDPYTFAKDGGFFLREKYLTKAEPVKAETKQEQPQDKVIANNETNWIGADKAFSKNIDNDYGPSGAISEAVDFAKSSPKGTTTLETIIRPNGNKWHTLYLSNGKGGLAIKSIGGKQTESLESAVAYLEDEIKKESESAEVFAQNKRKEEISNNKIAEKEGFVVGLKLGTIIPNTNRKIRQAYIAKNNNDGTFDVEGLFGNKPVIIKGMSALGIKDAIQRYQNTQTKQPETKPRDKSAKQFTYKIKQDDSGKFYIQSDNGGGVVLVGKPKGFGITASSAWRMFDTKEQAKKYLDSKGMTEDTAQDKSANQFGTRGEAIKHWIANNKGVPFEIVESNGLFEAKEPAIDEDNSFDKRSKVSKLFTWWGTGKMTLEDKRALLSKVEAITGYMDNANSSWNSLKDLTRVELTKIYDKEQQEKSVQNNEPAPTKQPETKTEPKSKIDFSEASVKLEDALNKWEAIKKGDIVVTKSGRALIAQSDAKGKMSIRFKAREGGLEEALSIVRVTGDNKVSKMLSDRLQEQSKNELVKKLIGKTPEGKDLYEDGRGVRFTDNGRGVQVGEDVAITMQNGKTVYDVSGRTDEHRTVEEVAARQPKPQPKEEKPAPVTQPESKPTPIASTSSSDLSDEEYIALQKAYNDFKAKTDKINATYSRDVALEIATGLVAEMPDKEDKIRQALIDAIRENQWNRFEINFPKQPIKVETDVELNRALKRLQKALEGTDYTVNGTFNGKSAKLLFSYKSGANGSRESVIIDRINGKFTSYHVDFDNMSREFLKPLMDATVKWLNGEEIPKMKLGDDSQWDYTTLLSTPRHIDNAFNEAKANAPTVSKSDKLAQSYDEAKTKTMEQRQSESRAEKMADHKKRIDALPVGVRRALAYDIYKEIAESKGDYIDGAYPVNLKPNDIGDMTSYYKEKANKEPRNKGVNVGYSQSKDYALDRKALRELADNGLYSDSYLGDNKVEPEAKQQPAKEEAPKQETNSKTPTLDKHNALMDSVRDGKATAEDFKQSFADISANKDAILLELNALTKDQLLKEGGYAVQYRHKNDKKSEVADAVYHSMIAEYALGRGITYGMGKNSYENAVQKMVESTDQQRLDDFAQEYKQMIDGRISDMKAKAEALENPQTLDDFRMLMRSIMADGKSRQEAFLTLSAEHRIKYDELEAESTKEARETRKRAAQANINTASQTTDGKIIETKHTRDGYDLFVVQLSDRLSTDDYKKVLSEAKKLGGWYSSYKGGGAIVGFQFKDKEAAQAFLALAGGDTTAAKEQLSQKQDDYADNRSQSAAERLLDMAEKIEAKANEELDRDRKANTARRARFAMSAENEARAKIALAKTMRNIAEAIKNGKAKFLDNIRMKVDVEALRAYITTAKDNEIRSEYDSYAEQVKRKGQPATAATADFATYPTYTLFRSDLAFLGRQLLEIDGLKKLGQQIMAVADDVSDAYLDFARKNLYKVSRFQTKDSALATFSSKETAERAIKKSGLTGKAIVLQVKRGENIVILSPSEAINLKVWEGDADKRITLKREFGNQLVEAVGRRAGKNNRLLPYQFQYAYDKLKALSRIGIETPSEFRSALREFIALQEEATNNKVREMEMAMVGRKKDGLDFFPTPQAIAQQMIDSAEITEDMAVLEPSAGMGHIADMIRAAGAEPDVIEMSGDRRELLQEKGYHLAEVNDFMDMQPRTFFTFGDVFVAPDGKEGVMRGSNGQRVRLDDNEGKTIGYYNRDELTGVSHKGTDSGYDRIIMNPPFSNRQDAEHVRHAYELLRPNGRIVAIMGEGVFFGSDKKAVEFREWLESVGGTSEKLPDNSFMDSSLPVNTGVNARMVIIDKQDNDNQNNEDKPQFSRKATESDSVPIYRIDNKNFDANNIKPHGLYVSIPSDASTFDSPHKDVGDTSFAGNASPKNPLNVESFKIQHKRGNDYPMEVSAGVSALKQLVSVQLFERLIKANKAELTATIKEQFPDIDTSQYYDAYELLEVLGAQLAIQDGYDAIIQKNGNDPFNEMVILDNSIIESMSPTDKPKNSKGTGEGLTTTQTRAILVKHFGEKVIKALESSGLLTIMATPPSWAEPDADGAYDKDSGKAYLFTDNLSAETVVATLAHELAGHKGFQEMMSPTAYQSLMRQFNRLVKQGNAIALAAKARAEAAEVVTPTADTKEAIALAEKQTLQRQQDELLPYLLTLQATLNATRSQQSAVTKVIEQVYRAVKAWLYRTLSAKGYDGLASKLLQPKDITLLAERMIREMGNGTNPSNNTKAKGSQFSQLNTPQSQINAVRRKYEGTDQWMKAPNGQPTKLNEMQWLQVRTPNFKAWFGDWENDAKNASKVVDKNGEPMVVYHGTKSDFDVFNLNKLSKNTNNDGHYGAGIYFSVESLEAETYGNSVLPVFLSIKNPIKNSNSFLEPLAEKFGYKKEFKTVDKKWIALEISKKDANAGILAGLYADGYTVNNVWSEFEKLGGVYQGAIDLDDVGDLFENINESIGFYGKQFITENIGNIPEDKKIYGYSKELDILDITDRGNNGQWFTDIVKNVGFDGVFAGSEIIAFDPTQIKSAIGNTGEFNPTNPDIRFSRTEQKPRSSSLDNFIAKAIAEKAWLTTEQINLLNSATTFDELIPLLDKVWNQYFEAKKLKNNNSTKTAVGVDNIKSLIRSEVDSGHITKEHGDLALYFAEKNPALFDSLKSFSFQNDAETLSGNAVGGVYNVVDKVIRISRRTNGSQLTIAHEVLHHAEEFLPENIKSSIIKAWQNDLIRAFKSAENGSNRKTMLHAIIHSIAMGDMSAIEKAIDSMDGVIPANTYHLFNPSEYWAENASRLMNNRSKRQDTWIENARSWINGLIQTLKNALGLQNDAAILKGLRMVLSGSQLKEGGKGIDIDHVYNMKMLNLFSYIGKFNHDGANKTKTSNEKYSRQSKNPITEGIKSAANDAKNSLPDPIAKSIDNFMAGRRLPSSDMANITAKTELSLYHRTIGTQQNTALQNADFKKVYDMAQRYLQHVAVDAYAALKVAPNLLGKLESWSDLKKDVKKIWPANFIKQKADRAAVASIIFDETLNNELLSDADILKALTRDQRQIYKEARDAIQVSLENTAKSEMVRKLLAAEAINWQTVESLINQDLPVGQFAQAIRDLVESRIGGFKNELEAILDADPKIKDALKTSHDKKLTPQTPAQKLTLKEARLTPEQMRTPAQKLAIEEAKATPNKKQQLTPAQKATLKKAKTLKAQIETTEEALKSLNDVENRLGTLIEQGYAPLMRFGEYTLTVRDLDGKVKSFFMFESKSEQVRAVNTIVARYGKTVKLETDMISKEEFKQFAGMTPETVALFAKETGMDKDEAYQRYLKHAIPARSAMTRMIKRKGTEGFSDDIQRVVASFVMSNARMSAKNIYAAQIEKSIQAIESGKSVKDQAYVMKENVFNPKENFAQLRNILFLWNLGGSIFFGLLNMTQPYMQTLPHLSQYVPIKEAFYAIIKGSGIAGSAMKNGTAPKGYEAEYNRAVREGVVDPQNVFMLSGVERGKTGASNSAWGVITHTMGLIAQVTESFNRKAVFIAALEVANKKGAVWLKKKGFNSAYDFAKDTVDQTQGVYDKANRSNWANTSVGAPLMVFKQFSINYVEQMVRMWKKEAASGDEGKKAVFLMLALLASLSGVMGLPFIKDILDVSETTAAFLGNPVNIEREARLALGKDLADPLFNGVLNHFIFNNLGMDMQSRTGMPDLVPWSNALNPTLSAQGRINEFASIAGATGGLIEKGYDATQLIARDEYGAAAKTLAPRFLTSWIDGGKMALTNEVMDRKGNKLFDTTWDEGLVKFIDANPKRMADLSRTKSLEWKDFAIQDYMTTSFKQKLINAMMDKDQAEVNKLMKEIDVWNNARSRYPVYIDLNTLAENANKKDQTFDAREKIRKGMTWVKNERPEM